MSVERRTRIQSKVSEVMRHSLLSWMVLLGLVAVAFLGVNDRRKREPTWGGHVLSYWLDEWDTHQRLGSDYSNEPVAKIQQALDGIGTNACPQLMWWLKAEENSLRTRVNSLLETQT